MILRHAFIPQDNRRLAHVCGALDEHLRTIEAAFDVSIRRRNESFRVEGARRAAERAVALLQQLYDRAAEAIEPAELQLALVQALRDDAPALRAADIGISVDSAVDIAKEAADIILLEKSLLVLDEGVVEGRTTFCNMLKYIRMTASSNFGNVLSVLVASAFLPFLPMLPLQLLVQNLLYDIGQTGIPFDNVDPELVARPLQWNPADIGRFMLFFGPIDRKSVV